jgi:hypothetical protein
MVNSDYYRGRAHAFDAAALHLESCLQVGRTGYQAAAEMRQMAQEADARARQAETHSKRKGLRAGGGWRS